MTVGGTMLAVVIALAASSIGQLIIRPLLRRHAVLDRPNERSSHRQDTLRGGGVALLLGVIAAGAYIALWSENREVSLMAWGIVAAATIAGVLGLIEDLRGLPVLVRAVGQLAVGVVLAIVIGMVVPQPSWVIVLAAAFVFVYINVANFMDGLNGMSGLHGLVVGAAYGAVAVTADAPWLAALSLAVGAVFGGFLPWNLARPGLFLGDVGSYLLGGSVASVALTLLYLGVSPLVVLSPLAIYLADTGTVLVRRVYRGEPIFKAHRTHAYQRLTDTGLRHVTVSCIVAGFTATVSAFGWLLQTGKLPVVVVALLILLCCVLYVSLPRMRGSRVPVPSNELAPAPEPEPAAARYGFAPRRWAVVGATGFVGGAVVRELVRRGIDVRAVPAPRVEADPGLADASKMALQAAQDEPLSELSTHFRGVDVVVNAAGLALPDSPATPALYGANGLLPAVVYNAANRAGVKRVVHISSAAVQGARRVLDESIDADPFSPYARSKALGERAFLAARSQSLSSEGITDALILRATSVQGRDRRTTATLRRIARSPLASVAGYGDQPTVVSSIDGLADFCIWLGSTADEIRGISLQPWEGCTARDVLQLASGKAPRQLPRWLCRGMIRAANLVGRIVPEVLGAARRVELMWFGQQQTSAAPGYRAFPRDALAMILSAPNARAPE